MAKARRFYRYTNRRARSRIKIATREIRRTLFYGELYPGDIKYLITRSALKRGNFCYRLSARGCAQAKGKRASGRAGGRASERSLVIRESRNISQRATVLPGEKGFRGIKIVFMECLKEPEKHFPAALGVSRLIKSREFIRCVTRKSFQRSNWEISRQTL